MTVVVDDLELLGVVRELQPLCTRLSTLRACLPTDILAVLQTPAHPIDALRSDVLTLAQREDGFAALARYLTMARDMLRDTSTASAFPCLDAALARLGDASPPAGWPSVEIDRLMGAGTASLHGRRSELARLDAAWSNPEVRVVSVTGPGGIGKSALICHWVHRRIDDARTRGEALAAFGWRFHDPDEDDVPSDTIERFLAALEVWLGLPVDEPLDARSRARRISNRIGSRPTLLVLDGVEALGSRAGVAIEDLLVWLRSNLAHRSLCIAGCRTVLAKLDADPGHREIALGGLKPAEGITLLQDLGLTGRRPDFEATVAAMGGHPLALDLLGRYLCRWEDGDLRRRDRVGLDAAVADQAQRISTLVSAYERQLSAPARELLATLALFGHDVDDDTLAAALADDGPGASGGPTTPSREQRGAISDLGALGLVARTHSRRLRLHPLVRAHLNHRTRTERPEIWRRRHRAIALHQLERACRAGRTAQRRPERALVGAIHHACAAGWAGGALQIYTGCLFGDHHPISDEQGALSLSLEALLPFFDAEGRPLSTLTPSEQAAVSGKLGFRLQALGRLREAIEPMTLSAKGRMALEDWQAAANSAGNLSSLLLTLGKITDAIAWGRRAVSCADQGRDGRQRVSKRAILAEALHRQGDLRAAERAFEEAEGIQRERQTGRPRLGSIMSYRFGALLLHLGRLDEVEQRAAEDLAWSGKRGYLLAQALDHLLLGRCRQKRGRRAEAGDLLDRSIGLLTQSGRLDHQPRGLIARAALRCEAGRMAEADADLDEAAEIADLGGMGLFQLDVRVQRLRIQRCMDQPPCPREVDALRADITQIGYACGFEDFEDALGPAR